MASLVSSQDFDQDSVDVGGGWASAGSEQPGCTVEISLDPELLNMLYRRSRRRLRDIQASCQAVLKLDRARSSLRASGSEEAIRSVRRHLENLSGPCKPLAPAVWAELMRTRTLCHSSRAWIARIQGQSGCRIHIERGRQEVRIFGAKEGIAVADRLLDEFAETCGEEVVSAGGPTSALSIDKLQALAHAFGITLRVEHQELVVLGIKASVAEACQELQVFVSDPEGYSVESLPRVPESDGEEHAAEEARLTRAKDGSSSAGARAPAQASAVARTRPPVEAEPAALRAGGRRSAPAVQSCKGQACPSCGTGRFCSGCGTQVWQVNVLNFLQPAQGMPVQPNGAMPAQGMGGAMARATVPPDKSKKSEHESQMQFAWVPMQQPQMFCASSTAACKPAAAGLVPMQFSAMSASPSGAAGGAQQPGQQMVACMVPAGGMIPAWCGY